MNNMALSVMVVGICLFTTAHTSDNGPEEFVLGFMYNPPASESDGPLEVYVTSRSTSVIRGNVSYSTVYQTFILYPLTSLRIDISVLLVMMQKYQSRGQKGVVVNTDRKDVNVVCLTKQNGSSDGFMSIPTSNLGQVYRACVYFPFSRKSQIAVIGVKNNTSVVITLSANANASGAQFGPLVYNPGDSISATINRLEVIAVQSTGDLSGSRVTADQKVVFYSGNSNTEVNGAGPGHLVEQLVPVNQWGTKFIVPSTLPNGTVTVKVISDTTCPTAVIAKICTHFFAASYEYFVLKSILTFEIQYQYNCFFSSDEPVMMVMYVAMSNTTKDPTMTIIPDVEHFDDTYAFEAPPTKRNSPALEIFLVLVVKEEHKDSLLLSGNSFSDSLTFDSVLDTSFVVGITTISTGYHTLQASGDFLAIIFGIDVGESYSFPLGMDFDDPGQVLPMSTTIPGCSELPTTTFLPVTGDSLTTTDDVGETSWTGHSSSDLNSAADASTEPSTTLKVTDSTMRATAQTYKTTEIITTDETTTFPTLKVTESTINPTEPTYKTTSFKNTTQMPPVQNVTNASTKPITSTDISASSSTVVQESTTGLTESTIEKRESTTGLTESTIEKRESTTGLTESTIEKRESTTEPTTVQLGLSTTIPSHSTGRSTPTLALLEFITTSTKSTTGISEIQVSTTAIQVSTTEIQVSTTEKLDSTSKVSSSATDDTVSDVSTPYASKIAETTTPKNNITCPRSCIVCETISNSNDGMTTNIKGLERVNRKHTSRYKRTLISASDDRLSVMITGSVGGAILVGLFLGIVALDLDNIINMVGIFRGTVKARQMLHRGSNKKKKIDVNWC